jgi:two-component system nitrate/nitrite response regulator NarL
MPALTAREQAILNHMAAGRSNKQIAQHLGLSDITVRHYLTALYAKCGVTNRGELLAFAHLHGLCDPTP